MLTKTACSFLMVVAVTTMGNTSAFAQFLRRRPPRVIPPPGQILNDLQNAGDTINGKGKYSVYVRNRTNRTLWVAIHYRDYAPYKRWWRTRGWTRLNPGQKRYLVGTKNRYVYFFANDAFGRQWTGNLTLPVVFSRGFDFLYYQGGARIPRDRRYVYFKKVDMGGRFTKFTYNFR